MVIELAGRAEGRCHTPFGAQYEPPRQKYPAQMSAVPTLSPAAAYDPSPILRIASLCPVF